MGERFCKRHDLVDVDELGMGRIVFFGGLGMVLLVFGGSPIPRWIREDQILHLASVEDSMKEIEAGGVPRL